MKDIRRTTLEVSQWGKKHDHVLYLNTDTGVGLCTTDDEHSHPLEYQAPVPAGQDQQGNPTPAQPGGWMLLPAADQHVHNIIAFKPKKKKSKEDDETLVSQIIALYREWRGNERDSLEKARESEGFYIGDKQWEEGIKGKLTELDRAALVINLTQKHIDDLSGYQRQMKQEIHYTPVEGGDQKAADLYNIATRKILDECFYQREKTKVFEDMAVVGRGIFNIWVDFSKDLRGDIKVERMPYDEVVYGPHEKEDLSDCEGLIKSKMYSLAKVKQLWPDKADKIQSDYDYLCELDETPARDNPGDQYAVGRPIPVSVGTDKLVDIGKKEYRVLECQQRVYAQVPVVVIADDDFFFNAFAWTDKELQRLTSWPGFGETIFVVERPTSYIRITRIAGPVVLSDENPADLPDPDFYTTPAYAKKRGEKWWGKVELAKDSQREVNYRASQSVDIGNKMCAYGWFIDSDTFVDSREEQKFLRQSSSPGFVAKLTDITRPPQKVEGTKFPAELVQLMQLGMQNLATLLGVQVEPAQGDESGQALLQRQRQKLTGNEYLFDNLAYAEAKLGRLLIGLIQRYYPPERILRLVKTQVPGQAMIGGQPLENFTEQEILEMLSNTDITKYDVIVTSSAFSPTHRLASYLFLQDMAKSGVPVPPQILIELMDLPQEFKDKLNQGIQAEQNAQAQANDTTRQMEIQKTLIAQGLIPPAVAQEQGIQMQQPGMAMQGEVPQSVNAGGETMPRTTGPRAEPVTVNVNLDGKKNGKSGRRIVRLQTDPETGERVGMVEEIPEPIEQPKPSRQMVRMQTDPETGERMGLLEDVEE